MNEIWQTVLAIITSVGGAGAIIIYLAKWLAQLIAEKLIRKSQLEYDKQLEEYKQQCTKELEKFKAISERVNYISNIQFETEFKIYQDIFSLFFKFKVSAYQLFPIFDTLPANKEAQKEVYKQRYIEFCKIYDDFLNTKEKYAPFIPEKIYNRFNEIAEIAQALGSNYPEMKLDIMNYSYSNTRKDELENYGKAKELDKLYTNIQEEVREYLKTLTIISKDSSTNEVQLSSEKKT